MKISRLLNYLRQELICLLNNLSVIRWLKHLLLNLLRAYSMIGLRVLERIGIGEWLRIILLLHREMLVLYGILNLLLNSRFSRFLSLLVHLFECFNAKDQ